ncbi:MAG TPA: FxsA family protein [Candidatus Corynebacterium gallistercoris]|uniref:FxsA family protein n=1 Tax=Candidatus Corynebacterium gallistercoris TaxID=2838530 RepID=A0A9D1URZ3_9CORY|nr:FxsA family protein [Candidatus Corynebacterium gallistercoris]
MPVIAAAYFIVEVLAFILLGATLGWGWALLIVLGLFVAGLAISTWQMKALAERVSHQTDHPGQLTADAALSMVGAVLVALPGLVSSALGILFLLPPTRAVIRKLLGSAARRTLERFGRATFTTVSRYGAPGSQDIPGWGQVIDHRSDEFGDSRDSRG